MGGNDARRSARFHSEAEASPKDPPDRRSPFQRDRDRILYTSAFRRLAGVTQVVAAAEGAVFHNRLTHTLEVAQISRRIAERLIVEQPDEAVALGVDPEVAEAAALAHDIGHPPFGHIAEEALDACLLARGAHDGFEGNAQSLRTVATLCTRGTETAGLDLTRATLNAITKYPWTRQAAGKRHRKYGVYTPEESLFRWMRDPMDDRKTAEAEIMDYADDIAYAVHDVEDFYRAGLIPLHTLAVSDQEQAIFLESTFQRMRQEAQELGVSYPQEREELLQRAFINQAEGLGTGSAYDGSREHRGLLRQMTSGLINRYANAVKLVVPDNPRTAVADIPEFATLELTMLKQLTWHYVIHRPSLATQQEGQRRVVDALFSRYCDAIEKGKQLSLLPPAFQEMAREPTAHGGAARLAADIVASMTEDQALALYGRFNGTAIGSVLNPILR